jgi:DUF4097 and DUF4098 domain-containing protein YvlB
MRTVRMLQLYSALALLGALAACSLIDVQTRVGVFAVGNSPRLEADVDVGRLSIRAGSADQVRVEATLRHKRQTSYQVSQSGDTVHLSVRMAQGFSTISAEVPVEIAVAVPPNTDLDLRSSSGYLYVGNVSGHITVTSSAGGLQISDSQGTFELETQTGSIGCRRAQGSFQIRTTIGAVDLSDVSGTWDVSTATGSIRFEGELAAGQPQRFASTGGDVDLHLLGSPDLRVDAFSQTGSVRCLADMATSVSTVNLCRGVMGAGAGQLEVRTSTGAITIR